MARKKKNNKSKPSVKVEDISPRKNARGGGGLVSYKEQKADGTLGGSVKIGYDFGKQLKA